MGRKGRREGERRGGFQKGEVPHVYLKRLACRYERGRRRRRRRRRRI
jgi:hypothetical protein